MVTTRQQAELYRAAASAAMEEYMREIRDLSHLMGRAYAEGLGALSQEDISRLMKFVGFDAGRYNDYRAERQAEENERRVANGHS